MKMYFNAYNLVMKRKKKLNYVHKIKRKGMVLNNMTATTEYDDPECEYEYKGKSTREKLDE